MFNSTWMAKDERAVLWHPNRGKVGRTREFHLERPFSALRSYSDPESGSGPEMAEKRVYRT